jgi:hypothetical protein
MLRKSMEARVDAAFSDAAESIVLHYLTRLRENMDAAERASRRKAVQYLLLFALFILLLQGAITEASFLYFRVASLEFLVFLIPIATAYIGISWQILIADTFGMAEAHDELIRLRYSNIYREDLELLLASPENLATQAKKTWAIYGKKSGAGSVSYYILAVLPYAPGFIGRGIIITELVLLFVGYGFGNFWVWASTIITAALAVAEQIVASSLGSDTAEGQADKDTKPPKRGGGSA